MTLVIVEESVQDRRPLPLELQDILGLGLQRARLASSESIFELLVPCGLMLLVGAARGGDVSVELGVVNGMCWCGRGRVCG